MLGKYGQAKTINFPLVKRGVVDFATSSDFTAASGDVKIKIDEGASANATNSLTYEGEGIWSLVLTASEMTGARIVVTVVDSATKAVEDQCVVVETYGHASAEHAFDLDTATQSVNVTQFGGTNGTFSSGRPEVNTTHLGGTAVGSATVNANVTQISGDSTAADNLEAAADGTGYNLGGGQVVAASVTDKTGFALTAAYDAAKTAASQASVDVIDGIVDAILEDTGTTIPATLATIDGRIDTEIGTLVTNVATILAAVDTEVAAIKAKTDNLPSDPADASDIAGSFTSIASTLSTIAAYIDTEVAAIKAKTDNLPASPAATSDIPTAVAIRQEIDSNSTQLAAIVADTNALQTDWADGGRLDLLLDQLIAYFTTSRSEPAQGAPAASASPLVKLDWLYKFLRNKSDQSETEQRIYADDGTTVDHKRSVSVSGGVLTLGEVTSGP